MAQNELGTQPLDGLLVSLNLSNSDLVAASTQQLTHKMVQKGRKGRRISLNIQTKILVALETLRPEQKWTLQDLFNYPA